MWYKFNTGDAVPALPSLAAATFNPNSLAGASAVNTFYRDNPAGQGTALERAQAYRGITQDPRFADVSGANQQNIAGIHNFLGQQDWGLSGQNQQALQDQAGQIAALQDAGYLTAADLPAQQDISGIGANAESIAQTRAQLQGVQQQLANLPPSATPEDVAQLQSAQAGLQQQLAAIDTSGIGVNAGNIGANTAAIAANQAAAQQQAQALAQQQAIQNQQNQSIQALQGSFTNLSNNFVPGVGVVQNGVPVQTGGVPSTQAPNIPVTETGIPQGGFARPAIDAYLSGNSTGLDFSGLTGTQTTPLQYGDLYEYDFSPVVEDTGGGDDGGAPVDTTVTTDAAGNPAPYLGVDEYDTEGDDNFLDQDEYQEQVDIITNQYDSWTDPDGYDPTKTFEEQLSAEDYEDFANSSLGENPAQTAADTIYNNNQQIYGEETGNNVTSLVTGNVTGLDEAGIEELQSAPDDKTWEGGGGEDSSPVENLINQQVDDYQSKVESGEVKKFDINDPTTWVDPNEGKSDGVIDKVTETVSNVVDKAVDAVSSVVSGGGDDGVGNFGAVGDFFGGIGDALGITDYAGEAEAKAQAEAEAAAQAEAEARAAEEAAAAKAEADRRVAEETARRQAEAAAEAERQRQEAARQAEQARLQKLADIEAERQRKAEEAAAAEAERKANEARANADMDQVRAAQDRLAAGEIDFATYLQEAGLRDAYNSNLGISVGSPSQNLGVLFGTAPAGTPGYVASDGPVNTKTGQHTVENEPDGKTAAENYKNIKNSRNDNDDPHMTHDEIISYHKSLQEAETNLIQSDLDDDEFWDAYEDDGGGGSDDSGGGGADAGGTVICTALRDLGLIDRRTWQNAERWAALRTDAPTYYGYLHWATPVANGMREGKYSFFRWAGVPWALQMQYEVTKGREGKRSVVGWTACRLGLVVSKAVGLTLGGEYAKSKST